MLLHPPDQRHAAHLEQPQMPVQRTGEVATLRVLKEDVPEMVVVVLDLPFRPEHPCRGSVPVSAKCRDVHCPLTSRLCPAAPAEWT